MTFGAVTPSTEPAPTTPAPTTSDAATPDAATAMDGPQASIELPDLAEVSGDDDLAQVIRAYNQVTDNLLKNYEVLQGEVGRLHEQLASTDAQLQRSKRLAALGEMAAGIAHEIRNPLGAISLYAGMLRQDLDSLASQEALSPGTHAEASRSGQTPLLHQAQDIARRIAAAVHGLDGIVNDVLTFSRELKPDRKPTSVRDLFARVAAAQAPAIEQVDLELRQEIESQELWLDADADLLHQAMLNLVRNAVDAMTEYERATTLTLAAGQSSQSVWIQVKDTGPGIADADVDRIFNPFFTTRSSGTGLGLSIVHRIVEVHDGTIAVHNDPDLGGAVFTLTLPAADLGRTEPDDSGPSEPSRNEPAGDEPDAGELDWHPSAPGQPSQLVQLDQSDQSNQSDPLDQSGQLGQSGQPSQSDQLRQPGQLGPSSHAQASHDSHEAVGQARQSQRIAASRS